VFSAYSNALAVQAVWTVLKAGVPMPVHESQKEKIDRIRTTYKRNSDGSIFITDDMPEYVKLAVTMLNEVNANIENPEEVTMLIKNRMSSFEKAIENMRKSDPYAARLYDVQKFFITQEMMKKYHDMGSIK
jgi:hypothetical protein